MASGFITLPDGKDWYARWSYYDWILKTIMESLSFEGDEGILKSWLYYILPNEDNGDVESGYCFYKKTGDLPDDFDTILRIIDTRYMKENYSKIFWDTVEKLHLKLSIDSDVSYLMSSLYHSYLNSLSSDSVMPDNGSLKEIFQLGGFNLAKE